MAEEDRRIRGRARGGGRRVEKRHDFYAEMASFGRFAEVTELPRYRPAPPNWLILIADIQGSTQAIEEGRYKDVNMVGAACIMAVLNVTRGFEMPYVFGGDGATMVIPPEALPRARDALRKLRNLSRLNFDLNLRTGAVPVSRLQQENMDVLVAKYELSPGNYLASFAGGGVALADQLIKQDDGTQGFLFDEEENGDLPDLEGLSCRWEPLQTRRGVMLSLLVQALSDDPEEASHIYETVIADITRLFGEDLSSCKPVNQENMVFRWPPQGLSAEARATQVGTTYYRRYWKILKQSLLQWAMDKFRLSAGGFNAPVYREELRTNTDYLKFDDMVRMVLDCRAADIGQIVEILDGFREKKQVVYGMHQSDSALMTCLLFSLEQSKHVHFIDGSDGGFAIAARQLKQQLKEGA